MASNYPTSLDTFTNPSANDSLNSPSHALQHANANDAIEALEAKLGIGDSTAGSATSGYVLTAGTGGTTTWSAPSIAGLTLISSQTLSASSGVSFTNVLDSTYTHYKLVVSGYGSNNGANLNMRARINTTDVTTGYYCGSWYASISSTSGYPFVVNNGAAYQVSDIGIQNGTLGESVFAHTLKVTADNRLQFGGSGVFGYYGGAGIIGGALVAQANAPTGFTIYPSAGTWTGTIALYGYKKSA